MKNILKSIALIATLLFPVFAYATPVSWDAIGTTVLQPLTSMSNALVNAAAFNAKSTTTPSTFAGSIGIGTTTPYAKLSVHANASENNKTLFAVASSTASATTTLFTVLNNGNVGVCTGNPSNPFTVNCNGPFDLQNTGSFNAQIRWSDVNDVQKFALTNIGSALAYFSSGAGNFMSMLFSNGFIGFGAIGTPLSRLDDPDNMSIGAYAGVTAAPTKGLTVSGRTGIGTSTPYAKLSVQTNPDDSTPTVFSISSTTASATSTLFTVSNKGNVGVQTTGQTQAFAVTDNNGNDAQVTVFGAPSKKAYYRADSGFGPRATFGTDNLGGFFYMETANPFYIHTGADFHIEDNNGLKSLYLVGSGNHNLGVGTTSPWSKLSVHAAATDTNTQLFTIASSTASATTTLFSVSNAGHLNGQGTAPALSGCGTTPTIVGDDSHGTVTTGATANGCTVTFAVPYSTDPVCTVTPQTGSVVNVFSYTHSATNMVVTQTGIGGNKFDYQCRGLSGI